MTNVINSFSYNNDIYTFTLPYGVCSTAAATAEKVLTLDNFSLEEGAVVIVKFTNSNSASNPTLNINGTGAKPIYRYGTTVASTGTTTTGWTAGAVQLFIYDGTGWIRDYWNNTTYSNASLGQGYATCSTAANTKAKTASLSSYSLTTGGIVAIKFTNDVCANATLSINSEDAKDLYFRGAAITGDIIKAGDVATFIYSTNYHLISIDRWQNDIINIKTDIGEDLALKADITYVDAQDTQTLNSAKAYTDQEVAGLVNSAPETLDTLNELAQALGDDPNFATTVANQIGLKADKNYVDNQDAANKTYTDTEINKVSALIGDKSVADQITEAISAIPKVEILQTDWEQKDEEALDFLKNKPFGEFFVASNTITWNGTREKTENIVTTGELFDLYKVSDSIITLDDLAEGGEYKLGVYGQSGSSNSTFTADSFVDNGNALELAPYLLFVYNEYTDTSTGVNYTPGIYLAYSTRVNRYISLVQINGDNPVFQSTEIKEIDDKYITRKMDKMNPAGTGSFSLNRKANTTIGQNSFAAGIEVTASGSTSHAEGTNTTASGGSSHAEGINTVASGQYSHAEGNSSRATGNCAHAEGQAATASGQYSHAEGYLTSASDYASHAEGEYTLAYSSHQHVQGKFNIGDSTDTYAHIVGNGPSISQRSNAHTLDWNGNGWFAGDVYVGSTSGKNKDDGSKKLATEEFVITEINKIPETAIIDVAELPVENINEKMLYRLCTPKFISNELLSKIFVVHAVETLPESDILSVEIIDETNFTIHAYYVPSDQSLSIYIDERADSIVTDTSYGWYPFDMFAEAEEVDYAGIINSNDEATDLSKLYLMLDYELYSYKNKWNKLINDTDIMAIPQPDLNQTDETAPDYIKNKPTVEQIIQLFVEMDVVQPIADENNVMYVDINGQTFIL